MTQHLNGALGVSVGADGTKCSGSDREEGVHKTPPSRRKKKPSVPAPLPAAGTFDLYKVWDLWNFALFGV